MKKKEEARQTENPNRANERLINKLLKLTMQCPTCIASRDDVDDDDDQPHTHARLIEQTIQRNLILTFVETN